MHTVHSVVPDLNCKSTFHMYIKVVSCSSLKVGIWIYEAKCKYKKINEINMSNMVIT